MEFSAPSARRLLAKTIGEIKLEDDRVVDESQTESGSHPRSRFDVGRVVKSADVDKRRGFYLLAHHGFQTDAAIVADREWNPHFVLQSPKLATDTIVATKAAQDFCAAERRQFKLRRCSTCDLSASSNVELVSPRQHLVEVAGCEEFVVTGFAVREPEPEFELRFELDATRSFRFDALEKVERANVN